MAGGHLLRSLPGHLAAILAVLAATVLTVPGAGSMYYERWGQSLPRLIAPLLPALLCVVLCLFALRRPRPGGWLLLAGGFLFGAWWSLAQVGRGISLFQALFTLSVMIGPILVTGGLFLLEARHRRLLREEGEERSPGWLARNYRALLLIVGPVVALAMVSMTWLPRVLSRLDDGLRGARTIEGNGVSLTWAPQGPGWNAKLPGGGNVSWNMLARYGSEPVGLEDKAWPDRPDATEDDMRRTGLCAHLDETGTALSSEPLHLWRLPTADEIVRSLTRGGENAGCEWSGSWPQADCRVEPDKETPLWAPDEAPIYYLAADEWDKGRARCVNYTGGVNRQPKALASEAGFRCVRAPGP